MDNLLNFAQNQLSKNENQNQQQQGYGQNQQHGSSGGGLMDMAQQYLGNQGGNNNNNNNNMNQGQQGGNQSSGGGLMGMASQYLSGSNNNNSNNNNSVNQNQQGNQSSGGGLMGMASQYLSGGNNNSGNNNQQQYGGQGQGQQFGGQNQQYGGQNEGSGMGGQEHQFGGGGMQQQQQQHSSSGMGGAGAGAGAGGLMGMASQYFNPQGGKSGSGGFDLSAMMGGANQQHGNGNELQGMMQNALGSVSSVQNPTASVDEQQVMQEHNKAYGQGGGNASGMGANAMGAAAAMQAFKAFASGGNNAGPQQGEQSPISKLLGMAMSEAAKLFDKSGGAADGGKQDVMNSAGQTMMKLLIQNQIKGALGGGTAGGSGGPNVSQLMGLASKFLSK